MQDSRLRERGLYRFYLYDSLGRPAVQGVCPSCVRDDKVSRAEYTGSADTALGGYTVADAGNITSPELETVTYYDGYGFLGYLSSVYGCRIFRAYYYDARGMVTAALSVSSSGVSTAVLTEYSYAGKPSKKETAVTFGGRRYTVTETNTYDQSGGLPTSTDITVECLGRTYPSRRIRSIEYDALGRVTSVTRSGGAGAVRYGHDLHGWVTSVEGRGFSETLHYADGLGVPLYNGSVSSRQWQCDGDPYLRGYKYSYNSLGRMTDAVYGERDDMGKHQNRYNESVLSYTANGAVERL